MVASDQENGNTLIIEPDHLAAEKQSRIVVFPIAIIEIARDQEEIDLLINGQGHQILERPAGGSTEELRGRAIMRFQSPERAVEVWVCCVYEAEHRC